MTNDVEGIVYSQTGVISIFAVRRSLRHAFVFEVMQGTLVVITSPEVV